MKSICLVNVFFGRAWPDYFPYFLAGCKYNADVDFLLFSNLTIGRSIPNVKTVYLRDLNAFSMLASQKLGFTVSLIEAFKLCDLKPAYGAIFEDYLTGYDFWGYCDIDIILGRVRSFLSNAIFEKNDVVTVRSEYPAGFCSFYKNTPFITRLYASSRDFRSVFRNTRHFCFDECNFRFSELLHDNRHISEVETEIEPMAAVIDRLEKEGKIRYHHHTVVQEFLDSGELHCWEKGKLINCVTSEEYLLLHLIHLKALPSFVVRSFRDKDVFFISPTKGLGHSQTRSFGYFRLYAAKTIQRLLSRAKWRAVYWMLRAGNKAIRQEDKYPDRLTFAMGPAKCTFHFTGDHQLEMDYRENGSTRAKTGAIYSVKHDLFLFVLLKELVLIRFFFHDRLPYRVMFTTLKDHRNYRGYLIK